MKLHPITGKILARFPSRDRCTRATGCLDSIFTRGGKGGSTAVFDVSKKTPQIGVISPMRPACQDGVTVAHGFLYWGPWICRCDYTQIGVLSLGPAGKFRHGMKATEKDRLQQFSKQPAVKWAISPKDWPTFRKNNAREAYVNHTVPAKVKRAWTFIPPQPNVATAPVAVGGMTFLAGSDGVVRAISTKNGKMQWSAYTGGGSKFPPTVWNGRVYVGSGDGHVYCYSAPSGQLLWRFRGAPMERRIPVFDSLISTWPIGTGVTVEDGIAYFAAGNANYNGTHVYALDAQTGRIKWQNNESGHRSGDPSSGAGVQSCFLLHNGKLHMYGGNLSRVVAYDTKDGSFQRGDAVQGRDLYKGQGKDLYLFDGQVHTSGLPLYFRQEDSHFIMAANIASPAGIVDIFDLENGTRLTGAGSEKKARLALATIVKGGKTTLKPIWPPDAKTKKPYREPFNDIAAVVVTKNAVLVAGVDYLAKGDEITSLSGLRAYRLKDGQLMWQHTLPALPVSWGMAMDRDGRILVSLQDGRVVAFE